MQIKYSRSRDASSNRFLNWKHFSNLSTTYLQFNDCFLSIHRVFKWYVLCNNVFHMAYTCFYILSDYRYANLVPKYVENLHSPDLLNKFLRLNYY